MYFGKNNFMNFLICFGKYQYFTVEMINSDKGIWLFIKGLCNDIIVIIYM